MKRGIVFGLGIIGLMLSIQNYSSADELGIAPSEGNPPGTVNMSGNAENRINQRQENQEKRIENGVKNNSLNEHEKAQLEEQQGRIQKAEDRAMSDGKITKGEARHVNRMQNKASRNVFRKKHNRR